MNLSSLGGGSSASLFADGATITSGSSTASGTLLNLSGLGIVSLLMSGLDAASANFTVTIDGKSITGTLINLSRVLTTDCNVTNGSNIILNVVYKSVFTLVRNDAGATSLTWVYSN